MKEKIKNTKGITLVALIITIIVLLILAVVAITSINNNKILEYAKNGRDAYNQGRTNETEKLSEYEKLISENFKQNAEDNEVKYGYIYEYTGDFSGSGMGMIFYKNYKLYIALQNIGNDNCTISNIFGIANSELPLKTFRTKSSGKDIEFIEDESVVATATARDDIEFRYQTEKIENSPVYSGIYYCDENQDNIFIKVNYDSENNKFSTELNVDGENHDLSNENGETVEEQLLTQRSKYCFWKR